MVAIKKIIIVLLMLGVYISASGQERAIGIPELPSMIRNIADEGIVKYWCVIEVGGGSTAMENMKNIAMLGTSFVGGYRFNQYLKVGAGLGILYYPNNSNVRDTKGHLSMPLFVNARGNILSDDIRCTVPFWSVNIGVTIPDGIFFTPSVGLRIGEKRNAFLVGVSYTYRHLKSYPGSTNNYSGALLKLGYEF